MSSNLVEDLFSDTEEPDSKNEGQEQDQEQDQEEDSDSEQEQLKRPVKVFCGPNISEQRSDRGIRPPFLLRIKQELTIQTTRTTTKRQRTDSNTVPRELANLNQVGI